MYKYFIVFVVQMKKDVSGKILGVLQTPLVQRYFSAQLCRIARVKFWSSLITVISNGIITAKRPFIPAMLKQQVLHAKQLVGSNM